MRSADGRDLDRSPMVFSASTQNLARAWLADVNLLTERLLAAIFTDNPEWTDYEPVPRQELREGCRSYLARILEILSGSRAHPDSDDVAAAIGRHRAAQGVQLEVMLRTFRLGGRIVWEALLEQARTSGIEPDDVLDAGTATWTVVDSLSSALSTSYRETELEQLRADEQRRHALIEDLLAGRGHEASFAQRAATELNLPVTGSYLVVVTEVTPDGQAALTGGRSALAALRIGSVWQPRADTVVGLIALEHRDARVALNALRPLARGRVGASPPAAGLSEVGAAHELALTTLGTVPNGSAGLVSLDDRYAEALLVRSPDLTTRLVSSVLSPVLDRPAKERDVLLQTLSAWLEENRSAANAAVRLHCHRNTVLNRLHRIEELTGRPLAGRAAFVELSLALSALALSS